MYHKVNDVGGNSVTVPVSQFDEQMAQLRELGYRPVPLDDVIAHYRDGAALPEQAVLITFDDGYLDNLENAAPILRTLRLPGRPLRSDRLPRRPQVAPARRAPCRPRHRQPHARLERPCRARAGRHPRRVARDRPQTARRPRDRRGGARNHALQASPRRGAAAAGPRVRLRQGLGGALPTRAPQSAQTGGLRGRVHLHLRRNARHTDPLQLHRYNVEPYPPRTFELVLSGACDLIALKDTVAGTHARRIFNAALGTSSK